MAGTAIKVVVEDAGVRRAMRRLGRQNSELVQSALKNIGEQLLKSTRKRFDDGVDPAGQPWAPLNPAYKAGKKGNKILVGAGMRGGLLGTIVYLVTGSRLMIGTNKVYAAIHQFGGVIQPRSGGYLVFRLGGRLVHAKKVTIPARPFLGISTEDRTEIEMVIRDHIAAAWTQPTRSG